MHDPVVIHPPNLRNQSKKMFDAHGNDYADGSPNHTTTQSARYRNGKEVTRSVGFAVW